MKIHPYLTVIQTRGQTSSKKTGKDSNDAVFKLDNTAASPAGDAVEVVSLENRRARVQGTPPDLLAAEQMLDKARRNLERLTKADLRNVHSLEGLVHVFPG
jgi:hypothetical protein